MENHKTRKRWIKLWTQETLYGTTFTELEPAQRSVWFGELLMAGDSPIPGRICVTPKIGYSEEQRAMILNVPLDLLITTEKLLISYNKIKMNGHQIIEIVNWDKYQNNFDRTEYQRQYMSNRRKNKDNKDST